MPRTPSKQTTQTKAATPKGGSRRARLQRVKEIIESPTGTGSTTAARREYLPPSIDLIADAVSEMLTTGTSEQSLDGLLRAAIEHISRRTFERGIGTEDQNVIRDYVHREIGLRLQPWRQDLIAQWRHNRRETPAMIDPKTITERIRQNFRDELEDRLERFLGDATPEEIHLLTEIMLNHESARPMSPVMAWSEVALGAAFQRVLDAPNRYMAVPWRMVDQVEAYVKALRAIDDKAVA
jgi:hypothetical protein